MMFDIQVTVNVFLDKSRLGRGAARPRAGFRTPRLYAPLAYDMVYAARDRRLRPQAACPKARILGYSVGC